MIKPRPAWPFGWKKPEGGGDRRWPEFPNWPTPPHNWPDPDGPIRFKKGPSGPSLGV